MQEPATHANDAEHRLAMVLGLALRHARETLGYDFDQINAALARALVCEAAQRVAIEAGTPIAHMPPAHQTYAAMSALMEDVKREARSVLGVVVN